MSEIRPILPEHIRHWIEVDDDDMQWVRLSDPILVLTHKAKTLAVAGFIPETILSNRAYCWITDTPHFAAHPVVAALAIRRFIKIAHVRYPTIYGHCTKHSVSWLRSLGAKIDLPRFIIEAENV